MSGLRYSKDVWIKIEEALNKGISKAQITRTFGVSRHSIWMHEKRKKEKLVETEKTSFWNKLFGK
jgi:transcriptional regulator